MARGTVLVIIFISTAMNMAVEARRLRQVEPEHFGFGSSSWWVASGKRHSPWSDSKGCYNPVTDDKSWTYYRMAVRLVVEQSDSFSPSNYTRGFSLAQSVAYGKVFDLPSNKEIGVWQSTTVVIIDEDPSEAVTPGTITNMVIELGPGLDDSLVLAGATSQELLTSKPKDGDFAITGGVGKYLGAAGDGVTISQSNTLPNGLPGIIEAELKIFVPKLKTF